MDEKKGEEWKQKKNEEEEKYWKMIVIFKTGTKFVFLKRKEGGYAGTQIPLYTPSPRLLVLFLFFFILEISPSRPFLYSPLFERKSKILLQLGIKFWDIQKLVRDFLFSQSKIFYYSLPTKILITFIISESFELQI